MRQRRNSPRTLPPLENAPALPPIVHASDREEENEVNNLSHHIEYLEYGEEDDRD